MSSKRRELKPTKPIEYYIRIVKGLFKHPLWNENEDAFKTAVVLIVGGEVGTQTEPIVRYTGYDRDFVHKRVMAAHRTNLFYNHRLKGIDWMRYDDPDLFMQMAIASELLEPFIAERNKERPPQAQQSVWARPYHFTKQAAKHPKRADVDLVI